MQISDNIKSAAFMTLAMAGFAINDAFMKLIFDEMGLYQSTLLRGLVATVLLGGLTYRQGGFADIRKSLSWLVLARVVGEVGGTIFFLLALFYVSFADVSAILQVLPLMVTLVAAVALRETLTLARMIAIFIGLVGVLIIIRPGSDGFSPYFIVALGAVFFLVVRDIATRMMKEEISSELVAFLTSLGVTIMGAVGMVFEDWQPVTVYNFSMLSLAAVAILFGYLFSVLAFRQGEVGFVAPFIYSYLVFAIILGIVMFSEYPDRYNILGSVIVVGAGIYSFLREGKAN
ncbi:DMT family transporter [Kordiimonas sp. SCSIO 12610]|uniref:DMT family transporter n=1 Tax=Kordiimonas sp. SCSIO 12610 TaxID=2829597 RepID=UPI00210AD43C|nr:DMT family transporter [Kordiimonas sp. SCSIO 12610]